MTSYRQSTLQGSDRCGDVNPTLPVKCKKTEILFLHLFLRLLENGGRAAVIVPDGVLFGSINAHIDIRKKLIEENRLEAVISMPSGVFRPYAGSPQPSSCSLRVAPPRRSGSTTWSTMGIH